MSTDILEKLKAAKAASYKLQILDEAVVKAVLTDFSACLMKHADRILAANQKDLAKMDPADPLYDRLMLNEERLAAIAGDVEKVASLPSPVGEVMESRICRNGTELSRVRVPLGVVAVIYEARPNVTMDVFALCFRTQNACVLRGGTDAHETNVVTVALIHESLSAAGLPPESVYLMPPERAHMPAMLTAHGLVDVIIPRGSQALIDHVRETASVPVIETGRGVVHTYFDEDGDLEIGKVLVMNGKTRRPSVCNSLDTLLVHHARRHDLPALVAGLVEREVKIHADQGAMDALTGGYPAAYLDMIGENSFDQEYLSLQMNVVMVESLEEALLHIRAHGSGHTDSIVTQNAETARLFQQQVDSSVVMVNASTAFSDGGEFDLGAEIGISTQKLHARGPMGLEPLTSYKWLLNGTGQIRG